MPSPCDDGSGFLCVSPGVFATGRNGAPIADFLNGGPYSDLDQQSTNTNGYGASLQATNRKEVLGRPNQLVAGASFDGGQTLFGASTEIGGLSLSDRVFAGPGVTIDQADGSIAPVRVGIANAYYGAFFTDTFDITPLLAANVAGRYNLAQIDLNDQIGTALTGDHTYSRFNPSAGLTYKILPTLSRLCELGRGEPRADPGRTQLRQRREPVQPRQFLCRRPQPEAGRRAHGRGRDSGRGSSVRRRAPVVRFRALPTPPSPTTSGW